MKSTIFIPKKIKVGFNTRTDTYTGKLGYVIYQDGKGVWRKEKSWEGWREKYIEPEEMEKLKREAYNNAIDSHVKYHQRTREEAKKAVGDYESFRHYYAGRVSSDKSIEPVEFENTPMDGFVLNKKAGGDRYSWNPRQTYCRVYDPRGFEFEIVIPNLLYILENASSFKGKGLDGKFIYGWDGKDLVLIPEAAPEFSEMMAFTELKEKDVSIKDLKPGLIYVTKSGSKVTYLGRFNEYEKIRYYRHSDKKKGDPEFKIKKNAFWFYDGNDYRKIVAKSGISNLAKLDSEEFDPKYPEYIMQMERMSNYSPIDRYTLDPLKSFDDLKKDQHHYIYFKKDDKLFMVNVYLSEANKSTFYPYHIHELDPNSKGFSETITRSGILSKTPQQVLNLTKSQYTLEEASKLYQLFTLTKHLKNGKTEI